MNEDERAAVTMQPIGAVRNAVTKPRPDGWADVESRIALVDGYVSGLAGIEGFSHLIVVCWLHLVPDGLRTAEPQLVANGLPAVGAFASRRQARPNPLSVSVVRLVRVDGDGLWVRGLDAVDGTPVLDIKPYLPPYDSVPDARMPAWVWGG